VSDLGGELKSSRNISMGHTGENFAISRTNTGEKTIVVNKLNSLELN
jgi:hypothetical protein